MAAMDATLPIAALAPSDRLDPSPNPPEPYIAQPSPLSVVSAPPAPLERSRVSYSSQDMTTYYTPSRRGRAPTQPYNDPYATYSGGLDPYATYPGGLDPQPLSATLPAPGAVNFDSPPRPAPGGAHYNGLDQPMRVESLPASSTAGRGACQRVKPSEKFYPHFCPTVTDVEEVEVEPGCLKVHAPCPECDRQTVYHFILCPHLVTLDHLPPRRSACECNLGSTVMLNLGDWLASGKRILVVGANGDTLGPSKLSLAPDAPAVVKAEPGECARPSPFQNTNTHAHFQMHMPTPDGQHTSPPFARIKRV